MGPFETDDRPPSDRGTDDRPATERRLDDRPTFERVDGVPASSDRDPRTVVEAHLSLLEEAPPIDDTPIALNETVGDLLELVSNAHALSLLYHLFCADRPLRFSELEATVDVTPKVLSQRLTELADAGLVSRQSYDEIPPRVEYEPTEKATALDPAFQFLYAWAARYGPERDE